MLMVHPGQSFAAMGVSQDELAALNFRLLIDGITPFAALFEALDRSYSALAGAAPFVRMLDVMEAANELVGLPELLKIERRTTERDLSPGGFEHERRRD
jgi:methylisocitrate lyase